MVLRKETLQCLLLGNFVHETGVNVISSLLHLNRSKREFLFLLKISAEPEWCAATHAVSHGDTVGLFFCLHLEPNRLNCACERRSRIYAKHTLDPSDPAARLFLYL